MSKTVNTPEKTGNGKIVLFILGGLIIALIVAVLVINPGSAASADGQFGEITVTGDPLPLYDETAELDLAIGAAAPLVDGVNFEQQPTTFGGANGEVQVVAYLAHWCPHCQDELPDLVSYLETVGEPEGVSTIIVASGTSELQDNYPPSEWLEREGWTGTTVVDDVQGSAAEAYGLTAYPYWVIIAGDGSVVTRVAGSVPVDGIYEYAAGLTDIVSSETSESSNAG